MKTVFVIALLIFSQSSLNAQTLDLNCVGTKTRVSVSEKKVVWENFVQTYLIVDGKINNIRPELAATDSLVYQLSPKENLDCKNYCNHRVEVNGRSNQVYDTNFSIQKGIKQDWEFRGICSQK